LLQINLIDFLLLFFSRNSVPEYYRVLIYINLTYINFFLLMFNIYFFKNIFLNNYWWFYWWIKSIYRCQRIENELLQIQPSLFNYWRDCVQCFCWSSQVHKGKYWRNKMKKFFGLFFLLRNLSVIILLINSLLDHKLLTGVFSTACFCP